MALLTCPSCRAPHLLDVYGRCERCRGEWMSGARIEAAAPKRLAFLRKNVARGPPTERNCPADRAALRAFDVPGLQYEGDLFHGKESPRAETHCVGEGCGACGGVWMESDQLARGGGPKVVLESIARLAESLA